jgi:hypothetical protein
MIDPGVGSLCEPGNKYVMPWKTEKKWTLHVYALVDEKKIRFCIVAEKKFYAVTC